MEAWQDLLRAALDVISVLALLVSGLVFKMLRKGANEQVAAPPPTQVAGEFVMRTEFDATTTALRREIHDGNVETHRRLDKILIFLATKNGSG